MTFKNFCKKYKNKDSINGDFACDVIQDISFPRVSKNRKPKSIQYKNVVEEYLEDKHACIAAKEAFQELWQIYISET